MKTTQLDRIVQDLGFGKIEAQDPGEHHAGEIQNLLWIVVENRFCELKKFELFK